MDREALVASIEGGSRPAYVFFWQPHPQRHPVGVEGLSQWYPSSFIVDGVHYRTAEHWMMAGKARLFGDEERLRAILACSTPKEAKAHGRRVRGFDFDTWKAHRQAIVREGSRAKFRSHPALRDLLLGTGDAVLVEASPLDTIWGIGLAADHPQAMEPASWPGENLLGFVLMDVREELGGS